MSQNSDQDNFDAYRDDIKSMDSSTRQKSLEKPRIK